MNITLQKQLLSLLLIAFIALFACKKDKTVILLKPDIGSYVRTLANNEHDSILNDAIAEARTQKQYVRGDFISLFGQAYKRRNPSLSLAALFHSPQLPALAANASDAEVLSAIAQSASKALKQTMTVLRSRVLFNTGSVHYSYMTYYWGPL